jgi:hypothetical protein
MKRILLVLPFVLAACDSGLIGPSKNLVPTAASLNETSGMCTLADGTTANRGFNEFGYNYCARIFNGPADGVDKVLDGLVWGDPTYGADHLVMKWNAAWDACNYLGTAAACDGAWTDNEWNGNIAGGSGAVWHYKIQWIGPCVDGAPTGDGGYCIWGQYEVLMDQGIDPNLDPTLFPGHQWFAHAIPNGYGN